MGRYGTLYSPSLLITGGPPEGRRGVFSLWSYTSYVLPGGHRGATHPQKRHMEADGSERKRKFALKTCGADLLPDCVVCRVQFDFVTWKTRRIWKNCLHYVCAACGVRCGVRCPKCRGGAVPSSRDLDVVYPVLQVYGRCAPRDTSGQTWAQVCMKDAEIQRQWVADTKKYINVQDTKTAAENPDWLGNRRLHTLRDCKRHGRFVSRQDKQTGCLRCAQGERRYISVENEPEEKIKTKRKRTNDANACVNEWLSDVSEDDDDDYSDLNDFIAS